MKHVRYSYSKYIIYLKVYYTYIINILMSWTSDIHTELPIQVFDNIFPITIPQMFHQTAKNTQIIFPYRGESTKIILKIIYHLIIN